MPAPPEPPPLSPAAARRAAAAARIHQAPRTAPAGTGARASSPRRRSGPRITDLHDLGAVARQLREEQARLEAQAKERRAAAARREAEHQLFSRAVGAIRPLRTRERLHLSDPPPLPLPVQHWLDEERVLRESISDDFDVSTLLDTDDQLSFRRPGIGVEITQRLRAGHWSIQRQLDLHGLRVDEAREALGQFIRNAHKNGMRCVRVVHGKGLGSPGKSPVLKSRVQRWLVQKSEVLAFVQARPMDGGAGALLVLLQPVGTRQ
ncbi:MAG: Smr/MutS family protein [Giesbergeria sp.]|nr:Smr/MutS family protein [Giesbergeria sp.]